MTRPDQQRPPVTIMICYRRRCERIRVVYCSECQGPIDLDNKEAHQCQLPLDLPT